MSIVFNTEKTAEQYAGNPLFLNPPPALVDTVNQNYPTIWALYQEMRSMDWNENEFDFSNCAQDFISAPADISSMMVDTIAWQWEADSVASRAPTVIIAPFSPATEVWAAEQRITDNEQVHANTYSEIVRNGMNNPREVISNIIENAEAVRRLGVVAGELEKIAEYSREVAYMGIVNCDEDELRKAILKFYFIMLCLERVQFMASFAITFTICKAGYFQEIGQAVKKIAQDELEIHCQYRKEILNILLKSPDYSKLFNEMRSELRAILIEVIESEIYWTREFMFKDRQLIGATADTVVQWVLFSAKDLDHTYGLECEYNWPSENPMKHLEDWLSPNILQTAPQEQTVTNYRLNVVDNDVKDEVFDF